MVDISFAPVLCNSVIKGQTFVDLQTNLNADCADDADTHGFEVSRHFHKFFQKTITRYLMDFVE